MKVYWHECGEKHGNLGDKLTPLLLDYFGVPYEWAPPEKAALFGIGSVLHKVPLRYRGIVWTTGGLFGEEQHDLSAAEVLAVRGKLTLSQIKCRERYDICLGDGGLLASLLFRPCAKRYKLGVIPHYAHADEPLFASLEQHPEIKRIDICDEPRSVIQQIGQCEHILSSSLHGLIVADSLGIPNRWIDGSGDSAKILGSGFKFRDYYSIYGFEDPKPAHLQPRVKLDRLLALCDDYQRPLIDDRKVQLLERLRGIAEPRSRYRWDTAKQDIVSREEAIRQRLEQHGVTHLGVARQAEGAEQVRPFSEFRNTLPRDSAVVGKFLLDCLSQIKTLHELGIVHGDIREANLMMHGQSPILTNFGWCVPSQDTKSFSHAHYAAADLRALGTLLRNVAESQPYLAMIASLLRQSQPDQPIEVATISTLVQLLLGSDDGSHANNPAQAKIQPPRPVQLSDAVKLLLDAICARDQSIALLRSDLESLRARQWTAELKLASLELARIIPRDETYILIDGDEWRRQLESVPKAVPFLERDGAYWGPPEDDDAAIRELTRLQRHGASYVVIGKPAFWWLEYYRGFRNHLESSADCCHRDELLVVYRLTEGSCAEPAA